MGTCRYCNQSVGFLRKQHGQCRDLHAQGMREMTDQAAQAAGTASFNETALRSTLQAIAIRARATEDDISQAIADGWVQGVKNATQSGRRTSRSTPASWASPPSTSTSPAAGRSSGSGTTGS